MNAPLDGGHPAGEYSAYTVPVPRTRRDPIPPPARPSTLELTGGAGLLLRGLWDELSLSTWIEERATEVGGWFRSSLMVDVWTALLWRPGSAWSGARTEEWLPELVAWLREVGVSEITVRLDKGFWKKEIVRTLKRLDVRFLLKGPNQGYVRRALGS